VAAGAADGNAEEGSTDDVGHLGEDFVAGTGDFLIAGVLAERAEAVKAAGDEERRGSGFGFVASELFLNELVVGFVLLEALDYVIAVAVGIRAVGVVFVAVGFSEADNVEPVAGPLLSVSRGSKETLDQGFVGLGGWVVEEGLGFFRGRGKAVEVVGGSPDERGAIGFRGWSEVGFAEAFEDVGIDGSRRLGGSTGLKSPVSALA